MRTDEVNGYGREALRQMLFAHPTLVQRDTCTVNLRTMRVLERDALVQVREIYDNDAWPSRPTRKSDKTWEAALTGKGVHMALLMGFEVHPEDRCMVPGACPYHTPFLENRTEVPKLNDWRADV